MVSAQSTAAPACPSIDEHTVLRDFEAIHATLSGSKPIETTIVGARSSAEADTAVASVARSWTGSHVSQEAADKARRDAHELLARWAASAPSAGQQESPPRPRAPPQPSQHPREPCEAAQEALGTAAPRSTSPTLSSSQSDGTTASAPSSTTSVSAQLGPDPVTALESQRQADATMLARHRLQSAAEWQQRALWQQRELEQEQQVHANNEKRAAERQRALTQEAAARRLTARDLRWARAKARAASALAEDSAARAKREENRWMVKARQASNAVASARDRRLSEQRAAELAEKERRAKERDRREQASRRWEQSRRRAEEAAREQSLLQEKAAKLRQRSRSRTNKDEPAPKTIRESWRPPLPYETAVSGSNRIPGDNRDSLRLAEGFTTIGTAATVIPQSETSHRRVGPEVRGTWSRYADHISHVGAEVAGRTSAPMRERAQPPSPVSGWTASMVERQIEVPDDTLGSQTETKTSSTASARQPERSAEQYSSRTTAQQPGWHDSPPATTSLPHEHVRSPSQSKPGRGSPHPDFFNAGHEACADADKESKAKATARSEADANMHVPVAHAPGPQPLSEPQPSLESQLTGGTQCSMDDPSNTIVTDKLIDLAYKITEGMSFKEPPSTPRRPDLPV